MRLGEHYARTGAESTSPAPRHVGPVRAYGRVVRDPEAPGVHGALAGHSRPRAVAHLVGGDGRAVEGPVDTEGGGEAGGALGEFLVVACREPPGPGELHAL